MWRFSQKITKFSETFVNNFSESLSFSPYHEFTPENVKRKLGNFCEYMTLLTQDLLPNLVIPQNSQNLVEMFPLLYSKFHKIWSIQNFKIGCIQFNKIFIQLENKGIEQGWGQGGVGRG